MCQFLPDSYTILTAGGWEEGVKRRWGEEEMGRGGDGAKRRGGEDVSSPEIGLQKKYIKIRRSQDSPVTRRSVV